MIENSSDSSSPAETSCAGLMEQPQSLASHLPRNFQRRFSHKNFGEAPQSDTKSSTFSLHPLDLPVEGPSLNKSSSNEEVVAAVAPSPVKISTSSHLTMSPLPETPVKNTDSTDNQDFISMKSPDSQATPAKHAFSPASLTPALPPSKKRYLMSPGDDPTNSPNKLVRRPTRFRSLNFDTPVKASKIEDDINQKGSVSVDSDIFEILPESLLQSVCAA